MCRSLLNNQSHSIEYINRLAMRDTNAFGLYICSDRTDHNQALFEIRLKLTQALEHINQFMKKDMLFAIYIDLCENNLQNHRAFEQMSKDTYSGSIHKILLFDIKDLNQNEFIEEATCKLLYENNDLQCFDLQGNVVQNDCLPMNLLIGV